MSDPLDPKEVTARQRYMALNAIRIGAIACTIAGIAGAREILPLPYGLSVVMAVAGLGTFFFAPRLLVRRWKAGDANQ